MIAGVWVEERLPTCFSASRPARCEGRHIWAVRQYKDGLDDAHRAQWMLSWWTVHLCICHFYMALTYETTGRRRYSVVWGVAWESVTGTPGGSRSSPSHCMPYFKVLFQNALLFYCSDWTLWPRWLREERVYLGLVSRAAAFKPWVETSFGGCISDILYIR